MKKDRKLAIDERPISSPTIIQVLQVGPRISGESLDMSNKGPKSLTIFLESRLTSSTGRWKG